MSVGEKIADTAIDECRSLRIGDIAQCVGPIFLIVRKPRIGRGSNIAGGEVGEQRGLARPAVTVTGVALRRAAEQAVSLLLLRSELRFVRKHRAIFRW